LYFGSASTALVLQAAATAQLSASASFEVTFGFMNVSPLMFELACRQLRCIQPIGLPYACVRGGLVANVRRTPTAD
jgi:hypothetical protein